MGIKDFLKKEKDGEFRHDSSPSCPPSEDSDVEHAYGHTANIQTGDASAATDGKSGTDGENYKTLGRWRACVLLITIEVGIGILSLPAALQTLGLIPGIFAILGLGSLTTYCGYILVQFYRRYPMVTNLVDCAYVISKPFGMFFAGAFMLNLVLICSSANITMSIALNTLSDHALCTVAFMAFPHFVCWLLCLPRKFTFAAALSWICTISIVSSVLIVMIALGVAGPRAPPGFEVNIRLVGKPTFVEAVNAILNIAFSFAGTQSFLSVMAEMRDASRDFPPALYMQKSFEVVVYIIVACVIYGLSGDAVTSPALGTAPIIPAKVAYAVLLPSVLGTGLVIGLTAIKYMYVTIMRQIKPHQVNVHNAFTWSLWVGIGTGFWVVTFIVSNAIPIFSSVLNISAAIFISWFTFGLTSLLFFFMNWKTKCSSPNKIALTVLNCGIVVMTVFLMIGGLYTSLEGLLAIYHDPDSKLNGPFTCADNSIF